MMTPKHTAALLLALGITLCSAVSCGGTTGTDTDTQTVTGTDTAVTEAVLPDIRTIAETLSAECSFSEPLTQNDAYLKNHLFGFMALSEQLTDYTAYIPVGVTPEEILVFEAATEADTAAITDKLNAYVAYQISQYSDYAASQVPKLDDPVIVVAGTTVIYVIAEDNGAAADAVSALIGK
ncbi:MAG: DUF4358 domain-containing protein [Clostridia bacterium]|nr:DUF4358 domain-containing protein [Clostridia bacterium]